MTAHTLAATPPTADALAYPANWRMVRLGDVADIKIGRAPSCDSREYWEDGAVPLPDILTDLAQGRAGRERADTALAEALARLGL